MRGRTPGRPRHVLVVAPQCDAMDPLARLTEAADGLYEALTDPSLGACDSAFPDGRAALLAGDGLTSEVVRAAVTEAIDHAAARRAVLVLAFLGHGFTPGRTGTLHLMCADSTDDLRHHSVNVSELLAVAADHPGTDGVLALVDTCQAAGAPPTAETLAAGARRGRTRLGVLMASSLDQPAVDLAFSRHLTALVRAGLPGAGPALALDDVRDALGTVVLGQNITHVDYHGDGPAGPLWLTHNAQAPDGLDGGLIGPTGKAELVEALAELDPAPAVPAATDPAAVHACRAELRRRPPGPPRERALRALDGLLLAARTVEFVRGWLGAELTTARIRRALHTSLAAEGRPPAHAAEPTEVTVIDELVFNHPATDRDGRRGLARFVVLLGQACGKDLDDLDLRAWAGKAGALVEVNDAVEQARRRSRDQRLSLVVSLHSSLTGDWPEVLDGWLLLDGALIHHEQFANEAADRRGAEYAIESAVLWAEEHAATLELPLKRLDLAVPGGLLLAWRPEEAGVAMLLGIRYEVRLHWSSRLTPDAVLRSIEPVVADCWKTIARHEDGAPVDWLAREDLADPGTLRGHLRHGRYTRGIGLTQHPGSDARLLEMLLAYTPVLLWPHAPDGFPRERQGCLDRSWWAMPGALASAYRDRWRGMPDAGLADLRAVWDDEDWLRFCRHFRTSAPPTRTREEGTP
ncbi:hypothetical protein [Streptomyces sp. NPDC089919]|uniref:vWA-MoxR associated conflict system protein n=1 Tax=Streptomyces sp. NPDC089919 TaxID=3155188 RepID=UPI003433D732